MRGNPRDEGGLLSRWEGEPVGLWRARWNLPRLEIHAELASTNDRARELGAAGAAPFTVVVAERQHAGRGRSGRTWHSPAGLGLWFSVVLPGDPEWVGRGGWDALPLRVGLATARGIERAVPRVAVRIEWPNDLDVAGRKVAGILCESSLGTEQGAVVAGVGVNVAQRSADFPPEVRDRAGSLEMAAGGPVSRAAVLGAVLEELGRRRWDEPELPESEWRELRMRDALKGKEVEATAGVRGIARGIDRDGGLRVESEAGFEVVRTGSVRPVDRAVDVPVARPEGR